MVRPLLDSMLGRRIGSYRVMRRLGQGGLGVVYEVVHENIGVAKFMENSTGVRQTIGFSLGVPTYVSPEQARGVPSSERTDVYALGVMLYEMLAGAPPFAGEAGAVMGQHAVEPPPPLGSRRQGLPQEIIDLVHAMLAKDPMARPGMAQIGAALTALAATGGVPGFGDAQKEALAAARKAGMTTKASFGQVVRRRLFSAALVAVPLLLIIAALLWLQGRGAR